MHIEILTPGLLSTIQDKGRIGYRHIGMPTAGCMDNIAAAIANLLVGNDRHAPVIEFTYGGVELTAHSDLLIACGGGGATLKINDQTIPFWRPIYVPAGTHLKFITSDKQIRHYVAIAGGWNCTEELNSSSTYLPTHTGGFAGRALQKGDILLSKRGITSLTQNILVQLSNSKTVNYPSWSVNPLQLAAYDSKIIRFISGHEYNWFDETTQQLFEYSDFSISRQSNRMGCYFEGPLLKIAVKRELLSTAVLQGTVQVTNSGKIVLLMADSQTTGGYPRIAQIAAVDLPICAQLRSGDSIHFKKISIDQAEDLYVAQQQQMTVLEKTIKGRFT